MKSSGDIVKHSSEWKLVPSHHHHHPSSHNHSQQQQHPVSEDLTKTKFQYERDWEYDHLRTTMLMFGPKMAPTKLKQYIFLYCEHETIFDSDYTMEDITPSSMIVLNVSFCEGVPLADIFKVLQYWTFSTSLDGKSCEVGIGFGIHYLKSSMFKSQIASGARDEMIKQIDDWFNYIPSILQKRQKEKAMKDGMKKKVMVTVDGREEEITSPDAVTADDDDDEEDKVETLASVLEDKEIVIITASHEENKRQSRRLSIGGNKTITIIEDSGTLLTSSSSSSSFTFYGLDIQSWILIAFVIMFFLQFIMLWRLSSEVSSLKSLLLVKKDL
jgi:hypothetical protein